MNYTINGTTKIITPTDAPVGGAITVDVDDVYSRWVDWLFVSDNSKYLQAMRAVGGDPLPGSKELGLTFFLLNGWKIKPYEASHVFTLNGNLYSEDGSSPFVATTGAYNVTIISSVSNLVDSTIQQLPEIQYSSFNNQVTIDVVSGAAGTDYPIGTMESPVNNLADAKTIAASRGLMKFHIMGNLTIGASDDINNLHFYGEGAQLNVITLTSGCTTSGAGFHDVSVSGRQSGETHYEDAEINELLNVHCLFTRCRLNGPIRMHTSYADTTVLHDCYGNADIDLDNSPVSMNFTNYNGELQIKNMNKTTAGTVHIHMTSGHITIDNTCTHGTIKITGVGKVTNNANGTTIDSSAIWSESFLTEDNFLALK